MVSKKVLATTAIATAGVSAQVDGIVKSIAAQISSGMVAARKSGVDEAQAGSEVNDILTAINKNSDIQGLFTTAANIVLGGLNSDAIVTLLSAAKASLSGFDGSPDFSTVASLVSADVSDFDPSAGFENVSKNLGPVLGLVIPPISSLSATDSGVASQVNGLIGDATGLLGKLGLVGGSASASTTAESSSDSASSTTESSATDSSATETSATETSATETSATDSSATETSTVESSATATSEAVETSSDSAAGVTSEGTASIITKAVSSSHTDSAVATESTEPTSSLVSQVNGQAALKGGVLAAGVVAAGALLL